MKRWYLAWAIVAVAMVVLVSVSNAGERISFRGIAAEDGAHYRGHQPVPWPPTLPIIIENKPFVLDEPAAVLKVIVPAPVPKPNRDPWRETVRICTARLGSAFQPAWISDGRFGGTQSCKLEGPTALTPEDDDNGRGETGPPGEEEEKGDDPGEEEEGEDDEGGPEDTGGPGQGEEEGGQLLPAMMGHGD